MGGRRTWVGFLSELQVIGHRPRRENQRGGAEGEMFLVMLLVSCHFYPCQAKVVEFHDQAKQKEALHSLNRCAASRVISIRFKQRLSHTASATRHQRRPHPLKPPPHLRLLINVHSLHTTQLNRTAQRTSNGLILDLLFKFSFESGSTATVQHAAACD